MNGIRGKIAAAIVAAGIGTSAWAGTGVAQAAPPLQGWAPFGYDFGTFGDHDFCRGAINVNLTPTQHRPGTVHVTLRSHGFSGQGAGWAKNPVCRLQVVAGVQSAAYPASFVGFPSQTPIPVAFGSMPNEKVERDIFTGPGLVSINFTPEAANVPGHWVPQGYGLGISVLVP